MALPKTSIIIAILALLAFYLKDDIISEVKNRRLVENLPPSAVVFMTKFFDSKLVVPDTVKPSTFVDCDDAKKYLTTVLPVVGFHVVCLKEMDGDKSLFGMAYVNGMDDLREFTGVAQDLNALRDTLAKLLNMEISPNDPKALEYKQPFGIFTADGYRLEKLENMMNKILFVFEGGQFIWPGIKIGHKTAVHGVQGHGSLLLETLSMTPLVFGVEEFLKDNEIDVILNESIAHLAPSGVTLQDGHEGRPATDWRTSTTYFLKSNSPEVADVDQRTEDLVRVPKSHQEDVQVLRYSKTQKYDAHTDYFPVKSHKNNPKLLKSIDYGYKNRMITVFWYMSDVEEGGHTWFPRAGGLPQPANFKDCKGGLKVAPQKRKVIVFYSMLPNGEGDPISLHGGCPVVKGTKFSGNKWVWNKPRH